MDNIVCGMHGTEDDIAFAEECAKVLLAAAKTAGISQNQIEEEVGPIVDFIVEAIESSADSQSMRLAGKYV